MRNNKNEFNLWGDWNVCTFELLWLFFGKEVVFSKTYPSFLTLKEGSTSHLGLLPSGKKRETALLGAQNRYALRLADHQRSSPCCAGWDRLGIAVYSLQLIVYSLRLISWLFDDKLQISCDFLGGFEEKAYFCGRVKRLKGEDYGIRDKKHSCFDR